jgi:HlyD family secretion protein
MLRKRRFWITLVVIMLVAGGGYYYNTVYLSAQVTNDEPPLQTTSARQGDLVVYASGTGTVIPATEIDLAFDVGGVLTEVLVQVGDQVRAGDVLARVDEADAEQAVASAESQVVQVRLDVAAAQDELDELLAGASAADIAAAQAALATAQENYQHLVDGPDASEIEQAELQWAQAKNNLWSMQSNRDATCGQDDESTQCKSAEASVLNGEISVRLAEMALEELLEPATAGEIAEAEAQLVQAEANLQELVAGPSSGDIAAAEAEVELARMNLEQAELSLEAAEADLEQTALVAPMDGTIMAVAGQVGENVGTTSFVTLADLSQVYLEIFLDETDLDKIAVGYEVEVTLDALSGEVFTGQVVQVDPSLYTSNNVSTVRALAKLDTDAHASDVAGASSSEESAPALIEEPTSAVELVSLTDEQPAPTVTPAPQTLVYTIQPGDTLAEIADAHGTTVSDLVTANDIENPDLIRLGQELAIPQENQVSATPTPEEPTPDASPIPVEFTAPTPGAAATSAESAQASSASPPELLVGLNAAVDVIAGRAEGAVLVPVEALRELSPGEYAVFVMEDGEPKLRSVEVGLMDFTMAEITSGLEPGEVVTTGIVETG